MSPLERLIVAVVGLEGEDALLPLSVLLPLYRHRLDEPALKLIEIYDRDEQQFTDTIQAMCSSQNMYWFDVSMHHNDQDLLHEILLKSMDSVMNRELAKNGSTYAKLETDMLDAVRARNDDGWPFFFIRVLYAAATDKMLALQHLPRLEPYLDEVATMVEQGYPTTLKLA